jgi:hypothetical protein
MGCTDIKQNIDSLLLICCGILGGIKTTWFRIYAGNLTNNYESAVNDYVTIGNVEHRALMRRYSFIGRMLSCFMVCFSYISVSIYSLIPFLENKQSNLVNETSEERILRYPIPSRCALEYLNTPLSMYEISYFIQYFLLILTCTCNHGKNDFFFHNFSFCITYTLLYHIFISR